MNITGIEQDINSTEGKLSPNDIEQKILGKVAEPVKFKNLKKVIYIDKGNKAHLAYHLSYYSNSEKNM